MCWTTEGRRVAPDTSAAGGGGGGAAAATLALQRPSASGGESRPSLRRPPPAAACYSQAAPQADLDLGNYERFVDLTLTRDHNITTGKIYAAVIARERKGDYLGKTVQVVPHITDCVQARAAACFTHAFACSLRFLMFSIRNRGVCAGLDCACGPDTCGRPGRGAGRVCD